MNPIYQMLNNQMPPIVQQFMKFQQSFSGDARSQVQQLLNSGRVTQQQYDKAVQMANQLQGMLSPSAHR